MAFDFSNPFADYGNIVRGERFIGRKDAIRVIENRIVRPQEAGNLAIIGDHRIGKSSLVYRTILDRRDELTSRHLLPIWINLGTYDRSAIFFRSLVTRCLDYLEELNRLSDPIEASAKRAMDDELSWTEGYGRIQRFFEKVRQAGHRILFILDEFDHARNLFKGDVSGFQGLRELSYQPEWRVTFVTTSRRSIREIEVQTGAISTFDGIFHKHYLAMFNEEDTTDYFSRLDSVGLTLSPEAKERIQSYAGGHPYLLEMLGYEIVETFRESRKLDVDTAVTRISQSILDQYDRTIDLLREEGKLHKLLQILFGPVVDVKKTDVDEFSKYGLIRRTKQDSYEAFSEYFQDFLALTGREGDLDLWPIWSQTEKALRIFITGKMLENYGGDWVGHLGKTHPGFKKLFDECRVKQEKEEKLFGSRASRNLIDFTYPDDLFAMIFAEWRVFKSSLGKDKEYWDQRRQFLARIRTPLAHSRSEALQEYERQIAEGYCKEILRALQAS